MSRPEDITVTITIPGEWRKTLDLFEAHPNRDVSRFYSMTYKIMALALDGYFKTRETETR